MTHLFDTSALLAHYLNEPGATRLQALFEDTLVLPGTSVLVFFEFESRLYQLGINDTTRAAVMNSYRALLTESVNVDESVRLEGVRLKSGASARISAMDTLIAATAVLRGAILVHRDPHFAAIPKPMLKQEMLLAK